MKMEDHISSGSCEKLLTCLMASFVVVLLPLFPASAEYLQNQVVQPGYVCEQVDQNGNCVFWREVYYPPNQQVLPHHRQPSYENDYRRPPPSARRQSNPGVSSGSAIMPSTQYAPGFGTSFQAPAGSTR